MWLSLALAACGQPTLAPTATVAATATRPEPTSTPEPPTATPVPLAARVNGQPILLAAYEDEVKRCQAAQAFSDCPARVLQTLIEQSVVEQAAQAAGLTVSESDVEAELARVQQGLGSAEAYTAWLRANFYSDQAFREAVRRDLLRARMLQQVTAAVGETAEQVHAQAILVSDEATARSLLEQIRSGADFATLAVNYSLDLSTRVAGGDLGWFPRGWLTVPEVEQAAFALQPGETSEVIQTEMGYYLVQVLERDPVRALSPGARQALRERAYQTWLQGEMAKAVIETLVNP